MGNRLKRIFANEEPSINGTFFFIDQNAKDRFDDAMKKAQDSGEAVWVDGIKCVESIVCDGAFRYPFLRQSGVSNFMIEPMKTQKPYELTTEYGKKTLVMEERYGNNRLIMETPKTAIIYLKIEVDKESGKLYLQFRAQQKKAKCIREMIEYFMMIEEFLNQLFGKKHISEIREPSDNEGSKIEQMRSYISANISILKKALWIENTLGIVFEANKFTEDMESRKDLEEIYLLLGRNEVIRLNAKVKVNEDAGIIIDQPNEKMQKGSNINITFTGNSEYYIWGKQIVLYTANLLSNIVVADFLKLQDGKTKILYNEEKGKPMYISYRGFMTEEEAGKEMNSIMDMKDKYINALTIDEYMKNA